MLLDLLLTSFALVDLELRVGGVSSGHDGFDLVLASGMESGSAKVLNAIGGRR